jgi:hypothetical protein
LFAELGENEVAKPIGFGRNRQKKLRRFEHPAFQGCKVHAIAMYTTTIFSSMKIIII